MPKFLYTAKSQPHETFQGTIEAESKEDAINKLNKMGYFPVLLEPEDFSWTKEKRSRLPKITSRDTVLFTRQLSSLIYSGVNVLNSLNIVSGQMKNKYLKSILSDVNAKIKDGKSLSESLSTHPQVFSGLYTAMVHAGEIGGNLEQSLGRLADFLEKEEEFKNSLRAALVYPAFVFAVSALTIIILLGYVVPRLVSMFEDIGEILPLPTKILIDLSSGLRSYGWLILLSLFVIVFLYQRLYHTSQGKIWIDGFKIRSPLWGNIILKTETSRLMRTLSLLLASGIPIVSSLDISASVLQNQILKIEVGKFKDQIAGGANLSHCLNSSKLFSGFVSNIVGIAEESGNLEQPLMRIADDYEKEVDRTLKALTRLLEPTIILVMGVIVGFIVLSMLLPIFQINLIVR